MRVLDYLKQNGIRRALEVIWLYKIPKLQIRILFPLLSHKPLEEKIIIESHNDFDCNGGALYDYLISQGINKTVKIIWLLNRKAENELPENVSGVPLYGPSWKKAYAICTAKWLSSDCVITEKVRGDQIALHMGHGIFGLKNFKGLCEVPDTVDYVLSPSENMDPVLNRVRLKAIPSERVLHVGYPVLDRLLCMEHSSNAHDKDSDGEAIILWMPTFRKGKAFRRNDSTGYYPYGIPLVDTEEKLNKLTKYLEEKNAKLVVKLHPKQDLSNVELPQLPCIQFITGDSIKYENYDLYDLMIDSSALITDYSGAAFEYLALNRPMAFVLSDLAEYKIGLIENASEFMPGNKIFSIEDLYKFISEVVSGKDALKDEREAFSEWFYQELDGRACERLVKILGITNM